MDLQFEAPIQITHVGSIEITTPLQHNCTYLRDFSSDGVVLMQGRVAQMSNGAYLAGGLAPKMCVRDYSDIVAILAYEHKGLLFIAPQTHNDKLMQPPSTL
eukprot:1416726-Amphidinium_carterae.1